MKQLNSYDLSRAFCDWAFENPEIVKPIHYAIYFFSIEHCNRLGWKDKFGLPSQMVMEAIGVKNWRTYSNGLNDLVNFGFIKMIETSKNQYSSNIIAIVNFTKASAKALDIALQKHSTKQSQSIDSIDKQTTNNNQPLNNELSDIDIGKTIELLDLTCQIKLSIERVKNFWQAFLIHSEGEIHKSKTDKIQHFRNWLKHQKHAHSNNQGGNGANTNTKRTRVDALKDW